MKRAGCCKKKKEHSKNKKDLRNKNMKTQLKNRRKTIWPFLKKLKAELPNDTAILFLGLKELKAGSQRLIHSGSQHYPQ